IHAHQQFQIELKGHFRNQHLRIVYIVAQYVMDYWWDDIGLRALDTELPDMSNVIIILGTAT
ncbi:MAG: hypothetical protein EZS28_033432, partial [Streblomastix strix]